MSHTDESPQTFALQPVVLQPVVSGSAVLAAKGAARLATPISFAAPVCRIVTLHPGELASFLWTLPALQALREGFPGARLCVVVRPSLAPFLRDSPLCDEVWEREHGGLSRQTSLMLQLRNFKPDVAVSFSRSRLSTLLAWSSGADERVGFEGAGLDALLTQRIECDDAGSVESFHCLAQALGCTPRQTHARDLLTLPVEAEQYAVRVLEEHGIEGEFIAAMCDTANENFPSEERDDSEDGFEAESDLNDGEAHDEVSRTRRVLEHLEHPVRVAERAAERAAELAFQAGARVVSSRVVASRVVAARVARPAKTKLLKDENEDGSEQSAEARSLLRTRRRIVQWPASHWTIALRELSGRAPVVLVGDAPAPHVTSRLESRVLDVGGQMEPVVVAAILRQAQLFVGTDSGVLQLAAAMGTPVVAIYGPTDWRRSGPRGVTHRVVKNGVECEPCELHKCLWTGEDERKCLTKLAPERVVEAARELIGL